MASASLLKSSPVVDLKGQSLRQSSILRCKSASTAKFSVRAAGSYADELVKTAVCTPIQLYFLRTLASFLVHRS